MYARILKFLTNLLFKPFSRGFLTPRKKRKPSLLLMCRVCFIPFMAFNKRQRRCGREHCVKIHRAEQYRARLQRKRLEANKTTIERAMRQDPSDLESEE